MAENKKPPRHQLSFLDAQDKLIKLHTIYRTEIFGSDRARSVAGPTHREMDDVVTGEPDEELEDAELSDYERQGAIARERARREGLI
jgi:hypothetical protein